MHIFTVWMTSKICQQSSFSSNRILCVNFRICNFVCGTFAKSWRMRGRRQRLDSSCLWCRFRAARTAILIWIYFIEGHYYKRLLVKGGGEKGPFCDSSLSVRKWTQKMWFTWEIDNFPSFPSGILVQGRTKRSFWRKSRIGTARLLIHVEAETNYY